MIKYVLIIWLGTIDNFADYAEFYSYKECEEKRAQVLRALIQAQSQMNLTCRIRYTMEEKR